MQAVISDRFRTIWVMIPKNASTLLCQWWGAIHKKERREYSWKEIAREFRGEYNQEKHKEYWKFIVLRDPVDRFISFFADKFLDEYHRKGDLAIAKKNLRLLDIRRPLEDVTLRDLLIGISLKTDAGIEGHTRPQYTFWRDWLDIDTIFYLNRDFTKALNDQAGARFMPRLPERANRNESKEDVCTIAEQENILDAPLRELWACGATKADLRRNDMLKVLIDHIYQRDRRLLEKIRERKIRFINA